MLGSSRSRLQDSCSQGGDGHLQKRLWHTSCWQHVTSTTWALILSWTWCGQTPVLAWGLIDIWVGGVACTKEQEQALACMLLPFPQGFLHLPCLHSRGFVSFLYHASLLYLETNFRTPLSLPTTYRLKEWSQLPQIMLLPLHGEPKT